LISIDISMGAIETGPPGLADSGNAERIGSFSASPRNSYVPRLLAPI
jgi:hypothetical protein